MPLILLPLSCITRHVNNTNIDQQTLVCAHLTGQPFPVLNSSDIHQFTLLTPQTTDTTDHRPGCCYDTSCGLSQSRNARCAGSKGTCYCPILRCVVQKKTPDIILLLHFHFGSSFAVYSFYPPFLSLNISPFLISL